MLTKYLHLIFTFFILFESLVLVSQRPGRTSSTLTDTISGFEDSIDQLVIYDTTILNTFYFNAIDSLKAFNDTSLTDFHNIFPSEQWGNIKHNLGNHAGSHQTSILQINEDLATQPGYRQYQHLRKTKENTAQFQLNRPYTSLFFSPYGGIQENFIVRAIFSRNFAENINLNIDFDRISIQDDYQSQAATHSAVSSSLRFNHPNKKYTAALSYYGQFVDENHNGGLDDISIEYLSNLDYNVKLSEALSRYQSTELHYDQWYKWINKNNFGLIFHHESSYGTGFYKYTDNSSFNSYTPIDSMFYTDQYLTDDRGLRSYNFYKHLDHWLDIGFPLGKYASLEAGLGQQTQWFNFDNELSKSFSNLWFRSKADIRPIELLNLYGEFKTGFGDALGTLHFKTGGELILRKYFKIFGSFNVVNRAIDQVFEEGLISKVFSFQNDFNNETWTQTNLGLHLPFTQTKLSVSNITIGDYVYFDGSQKPVQSDEILTVQQLRLSQDFRLWKFINRNVIQAQIFSNNVWERPGYFSQHQLIFESYLFEKALLLHTGLYYKHINQDNHFAYNGMFGAFYPTENTWNWYPYVDYFINAKVESFKFYVKLENVYQLLQDYDRDRLNLLTDINHYQVFEYPQYDWSIRLGVSWQLLD